MNLRKTLDDQINRLHITRSKLHEYREQSAATIAEQEKLIHLLEGACGQLTELIKEESDQTAAVTVKKTNKGHSNG